MDKNIAALLREDARTIHVTFELNRDFKGGYSSLDDDDDAPFPSAPSREARPRRGAAEYTYVTNFDVKVGDHVVVNVNEELKIVRVLRVDDDVSIEPNSSRAYKWVVAKVDLAAYNENLSRNSMIETAVADAYRTNLRRGFAQQILSCVGDDQRDGLQKLIGKSTA